MRAHQRKFVEAIHDEHLDAYAGADLDCGYNVQSIARPQYSTQCARGTPRAVILPSRMCEDFLDFPPVSGEESN